MIDFYNAFISYKHAELDSKVAEHVQRSLEHFHVPHAIRKKTGKKKIERIFRDKDELPITSDLTDTISNALEKADYLIVICSPNTKKSVWVQREIEFFLRNHTKKEILTVLADGDPYEVVPEILTYEEHKVNPYEEDSETVRVNIEPLSCDYRMPLKKAKKEEIPRLAAALIGCSYDELVRRQRAYKLRQAIGLGAIILAAALSFAGYMIYKNKQVTENYQQSLENESRYLATESGILLDNQYRTDALWLAMASIPQNGDDERPVVGEAVCALADATYAYRPRYGNSIGPAWNYSIGSEVKSFILNESGTRLAVLDSLGLVSVWDTISHNRIYDIPQACLDKVSMAFANDDILVLVTDEKVTAYNVSNGQFLWQYELETEFDLFCDADPLVSENEVIIFDNAPAVSFLDVYTGQLIERNELDISSLDSWCHTPYDMALSPDGRKIAFDLSSLDESYVLMYDIPSGRLTISDMVSNGVSDLGWGDDQHILLSTYAVGEASSYRMGEQYVLIPSTHDITCFDSSDLDVLWTNRVESTAIIFSSGFFELGDNVGYALGDKVFAFDVDTGDIIHEWITNDSILLANDQGHDGIPHMFTRDGALGSPIPDTWGADGVSFNYLFVDSIQNIAENHGLYVSQLYGTDIIYYTNDVYDHNWTMVSDSVYGSVQDRYVDNNVVSFASLDSDGVRITVIDPNHNDNIVFDEVLVSGSYSSDMKILGADEEYVYILYSSYEVSTLYKIKISNGRVYEDDLTSYRIPTDGIIMLDGCIAYIDGIGSDCQMVVYNCKSGDTIECDLPMNGLNITIAPVYDADLGIVYVASTEGDYIVDCDSEDCERVDLPNNWARTSVVATDPMSDRIVITDGTRVLVVDRRGDIVYEINIEGRNVIGLLVMEDENYEDPILVTLYSDGYLCKYDASNGTLLASTSVNHYSNYLPTVTFEVDRNSGYLYVNQEDLLSVVSLEDWVEHCHVEFYIGHHALTDRFFTFQRGTEGDVYVGYYHHYSLTELIRMATDILGTNTLPEEIIYRYGLDDSGN